MNEQNNIEHLKDLLGRGLIDVAEANIRKVEMERFKLVTNKLTRDLRNAMNKGVKEGRLKRKRREGHKPECYYHHNFEYLANDARNKEEQAIKNAVLKIQGWIK